MNGARHVACLLALGALAASRGTVIRAQSGHTAYLPVLGEPARPHSQPTPAGEALTLVGEVGGASAAVAVHGEVAYLGEEHRVVVVDLSEPKWPSRPAERGPFSGFARDLAVDGEGAYVADGPGGLQIFQVEGDAPGTAPAHGP